MTYHIQTAIDNAIEGDTIRAWNGTYYENNEVTEELTILGMGTFTIISGDNDTAIEIAEDSVTIKNIMIVSSEKGIYLNSVEDTIVDNVKFRTSEYGIHSENTELIVNNSIFDVVDYGIYLASSSTVKIKDNGRMELKTVIIVFINQNLQKMEGLILNIIASMIVM